MTFQRRRGRISTEKTEVRICVHAHTHEHGHDHGHTHEHHSPEETVALLAYMVTHNQHHAEELHELAHSVEGEAAQLLHEAVVDLTVGNEKLAEALRILKGEE